jgi:hypothetical protein
MANSSPEIASFMKFAAYRSKPISRRNKQTWGKSSEKKREKEKGESVIG